MRDGRAAASLRHVGSNIAYDATCTTPPPDTDLKWLASVDAEEVKTLDVAIQRGLGTTCKFKPGLREELAAPMAFGLRHWGTAGGANSAEGTLNV